MTDEQRQRLSALLDGEGSAFDQQQAIADAMAQPALQDCWERYAIIGRALRGEPVSVGARALAPRVAELIAGEAQVGAELITAGPQRPAGAGMPPPARGSRERWWGRSRRRPAGERTLAARPLVGFALAAGVALLAGMAGSRLWLADVPDTPDLAAAADDTLLQRWRTEDAQWLPVVAGANAPRLNELLVSHQERSASRGLTGFMPYATLVGYGGAR